jgi:hypothetical protein
MTPPDPQQVAEISPDITLRCDKCKREQSYPRSVDPSIPARVATIVVSRCDRCDIGDFGTEWWLDANGKEVVND